MDGVRSALVFARICEPASSALIFASTSRDKICLASSEHFVNFPLAGISLLLKGIFFFAPSNLANTQRKTEQ